MTIEIKKGERREVGTLDGDSTTRVRYERDVFDSGVHVATFVPNEYSVTYSLVDSQGCYISNPNGFNYEALSLGEMSTVYEKAKDEGQVPNHMQYELRRMKDVMQRQRECVQDYHRTKRAVLNHHAEALLAAAEAMLSAESDGDVASAFSRTRAIVEQIKYTEVV